MEGKSKFKILLVEDEKNLNRTVCSFYLSSFGIRCSFHRFFYKPKDFQQNEFQI